MKPGLYEARSLIGGGAQLVVLDDAEARIKLWKALGAIGKAYQMSGERRVRAVLARALSDVEEGA